MTGHERVVAAPAAAARFAFALVLALVHSLGGCASGAGGGPVDRWQTTLGRASFEAVERARGEVWVSDVRVRLTERRSRAFLMESEWVARSLAPAETANGVVEARVRYRVLGSADTTGEGDSVFTVILEVRHEVRTTLVPEWHPFRIPGDAIERARTHVDQLRAAIRAGGG